MEEDVAFGPENMGIPAEEIEMRITKALASTGMTAYREASPGCAFWRAEAEDCDIWSSCDGTGMYYI